MSNSNVSPAAGKLLILADTTLVSVLERNRLRSLDLEPSSSDENDIQRNLIMIKDGIAQLEREQTAAETDSSLSSQSLRSREDTLIRLQKQYDKLMSLLQDGGADKIISKVQQSTPIRPSLVTSRSQENADGTRRTIGGGRKVAKTVRFSDNLIDVSSTPDPLSLAAEEARNSATNQEALQQQQRIMQQQDESLDRLSESISRQRELSIQIGDEVDSHIELLSDVERMVDWGQNRLDRARKRLDHVSKKAKENGSILTIAILIIVLLILIIIL
ncbi:uncharacterized protein V1516DRAFT_678443, partial [Lipomyces oligophaga]|uniref:uncharacterized protein n=1 Tax=Lipomyces oligophaga TaxID=45792 RepID=UPI0034CE48C0